MKGVLVLAKVEQVFKLELSFSVGFAEELELEYLKCNLKAAGSAVGFLHYNFKISLYCDVAFCKLKLLK